MQSAFDINGVKSVKDRIALSEKFGLRKTFFSIGGFG